MYIKDMVETIMVFVYIACAAILGWLIYGGYHLVSWLFGG